MLEEPILGEEEQEETEEGETRKEKGCAEAERCEDSDGVHSGKDKVRRPEDVETAEGGSRSDDERTPQVAQGPALVSVCLSLSRSLTRSLSAFPSHPAPCVYAGRHCFVEG